MVGKVRHKEVAEFPSELRFVALTLFFGVANCKTRHGNSEPAVLYRGLNCVVALYCIGAEEALV